MSLLADLPELVGFFSYSREDDDDSNGALSALRDRIQRELRGQLGRSRVDFRLWQDKGAIAHGTLWEDEIKSAVAQSVFFVPIVTPTAVRSKYCQFEFETFLAREAELGRKDLIFPILYIRVPALETEQWREHAVLKIIGARQYADWQRLRLVAVDSPQVAQEVAQFCRNIFEALQRSNSEAEDRHKRGDTGLSHPVTDDRERARPVAASAQDIARKSEPSHQEAEEVPAAVPQGREETVDAKPPSTEPRPAAAESRSEAPEPRSLAPWLLSAGIVRVVCTILFVLGAQRALSEPGALAVLAALIASGGIGILIGRGIRNENQFSPRTTLICLGAGLVIETAWLIFCLVVLAPPAVQGSSDGKVLLLLSFPTPLPIAAYARVFWHFMRRRRVG
jgi:hypothetical protein